MQAVERYLNYNWFGVGSTQNVLPSATPLTVSGTGVLDLNGSNQAVGSLTGADSTAEVKLTSGSTLTVGSLNTATTYAGMTTGTGNLTKVGSAKLSLTGNNTYTGATLISLGELNVNGTLNGTSGITIAAAAKLSGTGTITSAGIVTLQSGAKLAPGNSPGTLFFNANVDLSATVAGSNVGNLEFELGAVGASDQISLTGGTITIGLGELNFNDFTFTALSGFAPGVYTLFDGVNPITGSLGSSLVGVIGGYDSTLSLADGTNDLILTVVPEPTSLGLLGAAATLIIRRRRRIA
jgi:autotransporter-associated beta strand protein